jgi:hypothetical protein
MNKVKLYGIVAGMVVIIAAPLTYAVFNPSVEEMIGQQERIMSLANKTAEQSRETQAVIQKTIDQFNNQLSAEKQKELAQKAIYEASRLTIEALKAEQGFTKE